MRYQISLNPKAAALRYCITEMVDLLKRKILLIDKRSITGNKHVYFIFKNENFTVDSVVEPASSSH